MHLTKSLARAAKIFKTLSSMLKSSLGRFVVFCLISAKTATDRRRESNLSAEFEASYIPTISANIVESMGRHNRQMQGDGYWSPANSDLNSNSVHRKPSLHQSLSVQSPTNIPINNDYITNERNKQQTLFEIFSTVILYYLRSYYLYHFWHLLLFHKHHIIFKQFTNTLCLRIRLVTCLEMQS